VHGHRKINFLVHCTVAPPPLPLSLEMRISKQKQRTTLSLMIICPFIRNSNFLF